MSRKSIFMILMSAMVQLCPGALVFAQEAVPTLERLQFPHRTGTGALVFAQEAVPTIVVIGSEIVVTASRLKTLVKDTPTQVTVIDSKEIARSGAWNVDDLLRDVCGVDVSRRAGFTSSGSIVTLRGFGGQARGRTLVLIDGIPFNEIYGGEVYWNAIPMEDIERIEVIPGASSHLYGPGAMGGVINILTKKCKKLETGLTAKYGAYDSPSFGMRHQNILGKFGYLVSGSWFKTDGYVAAVDKKDYDIKRNKKSSDASLKLNYDFGENDSIGVGYRHYKEDVNAGRTYYYGSKNLNDLHFNLTKWFDNSEFLTTLYFDWEDSSWTYDKSPYTTIDYINKNPKQGSGGNLQSNIHLSERNTFSIGTDWRLGKIDSVDDYKSTVRRVQTKGKQNSFGIYFQDELRLYEKFIINFGGRWDYWKSYDGYLYDDNLSPKQTYYEDRSQNTLSPKIGLIYHLTGDTTLRSCVGKSFRTPTLYDLYKTWKYGKTTYQANPNLKPEKAYSYELGLDQKILEVLLGRFTVYYSDVSDLIYSISVGTTTKERQNVGKVQIYGAEVQINYKPIKELSVFANHTFNSSKIMGHSDPKLEGKYLTYTPKNKYSFGCAFRNSKLGDIEVIGRYTGDVFHDDANTQKVKGHLIWDSTLSRNITDHFDLIFKIENIADKRYEEYKGILAPDRMVSASTKIKF
ncbi:MAG: TonB-dependent receptor [Candidatus Omnitrophota bacterium]